MKPLYIFDLDGTLANIEHRAHLIDRSREGGADWPAFYKRCVDDKPIHAVIHTLIRLAKHATIWIFSGRSDEVRDETIWWLNHHVGHHYDALHMRPAGDFTSDDKLKLRWLNDMAIQDRERLIAVFEDRDRMVKMWREQGIACFQVAPGEF